jgi:hypothetical protein
MPVDSVRLDVVAAQAREIQMESVCRHANVYDCPIALMASGRVDLKPFATRTSWLDESIAAPRLRRRATRATSRCRAGSAADRSRHMYGLCRLPWDTRLGRGAIAICGAS